MSRTLAMLLLLISLPLWAQETDPAEAGSTGDDAQTQTGPGEQPVAESQQEARPPERDSPFDYQSSEQISEDLSVSFPVDI